MDSPNATRSKLTALLPTFNEEANIADCIASVAWADEIFVVDSFSTDRTREIAVAAGARVVEHEYVNSATQKNWAIPQCAHEWVLIVDSDERVTPGLRDEILAVLAQDAAGQTVHDGFRIGRINHFLGRRVLHCGWQNDTVLRLFRRDKGRYQEREVHADVVIAGSRVGRLRNKFLHYTFRDFDQYMRKFDRYTSWAAGDRGLRTERVGFIHLLLRPMARFFKQYVLKRGFLDGRIGLIICLLASYSVFMKYAKLLERQLKGEPTGTSGELAESSDPSKAASRSLNAKA